mgnify:CR=1 FL=1
MPRRKKRSATPGDSTRDFGHADARRRNNPPAGIALPYEVRKQRTRSYAYDPHLVWMGRVEHASFGQEEPR